MSRGLILIDKDVEFKWACNTEDPNGSEMKEGLSLQKWVFTDGAGQPRFVHPLARRVGAGACVFNVASNDKGGVLLIVLVWSLQLCLANKLFPELKPLPLWHSFKLWIFLPLPGKRILSGTPMPLMLLRVLQRVPREKRSLEED